MAKKTEKPSINQKGGEEATREFISAVSHELKTPMAIIKESLSLVLSKIAGPINDEQTKILNIAKDNIDRLAQKMNELSARYKA